MSAVTVALLKEDYPTGKKEKEKFVQHKVSDLYSDWLHALTVLKANPISAMLSAVAAQEQNTAWADKACHLEDTITAMESFGS